MPRGDKSSYTDKQKRQAAHIEDSYEARGVDHDEAERRAWATVNAESGGGKKSGSGRRKAKPKSPAAREEQNPRPGQTYSAAHDSHDARSEAAKRGWETRRRRAAER